MKVQFKKNIIGIISFIIQLNLYAQTDPKPQDYLPNIVPPSPEASSLGNYGNVPVGLFTGTLNLNLPLIQFKTKNIVIPFSLSYASNGIKVDDVNSRVGLGWNLIGGGVINRTIRDIPDDIFFDYDLKHLPIKNISPYNALVNKYFNLHGENEGYDTERDLFSFNFLDNSGKFYIDDNNNIVFLEKSNLKIEITYKTGDDIFKFIITDQKGIKYYFESTEQTLLRTSGEGHTLPSLNYTAWYLNKIVHPSGNEIYFEYEDYIEYYIASQSQQVSKSFPTVQSCQGLTSAYAKAATVSPIYSHHTKIIGKRLKRVFSNNIEEGELVFSFEDKFPGYGDSPDNVIKDISLKNKNSDVIDSVSFEYLVTDQKRIFLEKMTFKDQRTYLFNYISPLSFPARLSKSQDYWGYYNGEANINLVPKPIGYGFDKSNYLGANKEINQSLSKIGLLSQITYPTKGTTNFEYESNQVYKNVTKLPSQKYKFTLNVDTDDVKFRKEASYNFFTYFDHEVELTGDAIFYNCEPSMNVGASKHKSIITVFCVEDNQYKIFYNYDQYGYATSIGQSIDTNLYKKFYFSAEKGKNYILKIVNNFNCTKGFVTINYYKEDNLVTKENVVIGGNRIKKTIDKSDLNLQPVVKNYYYNSPQNINQSSGFQDQDPFYFDFNKFKYENCFRKDVVVSSSSLLSLFSNSSNSAAYQYVTVYSGENKDVGYEINEFQINSDYREHIYRGLDEFRNVPYSNLGWDNGKLLKTKIYAKENNAFKLIKEVENVYSKVYEDPLNINFSVRNPYQGLFDSQNSDACLCDSSNINEAYSVLYCSTYHLHKKNNLNQCISSNANNISTLIKHPCFDQPIGIVINIPSISHLDIMPYKYLSNFPTLTKTITKEYSQSGLITNEVNYVFDNPNHLQLTSQTTKTSASNVLVEKKYQYAHEMANQPMIEANMISIPLKTETFRNGSLIGMQETVYQKNTVTNNLILPTQVFSKKDNQQASELKATYNNYDDKGNVTQYTIESGMPVTIIWGYNKTQPIAKIENARYADVQQYEANLQTLSNGTDENALLLALNTLRSNFPNAMVTTYTHKPLIGVSTVTIPIGEKVTYIYDEFNRLKQVIDHNGNILNENQYNYRAQ